MKESEDEISLKELFLKGKTVFLYLLKNWIVILIFGIIGGLAGILYAYINKPVYKAITTFVLEDEKSGGGLGSLGGLASMAGIDLGTGGGGIFQGDNILELYKSRSMIEKALLTKADFNGQKQLLVDRYIQINHLRESWAKKEDTKKIQFSSNPMKPDRSRDSVMGIIVKNINEGYLKVSKPDKKLSKIEAVVISKDEFFAKKFDEAIVKTVNDFYVKTKTKKSEENIRLLQSKLDSVRSIVYGSISDVAAISDATPNLNPTRQILRSGSQRSLVVIEANKAILAQLIQNLELAKISMQKDAPLIQIVDEPIFPLEVIKLGKASTAIKFGFIAGILIVLILITRLFIRNILSSE